MPPIRAATHSHPYLLDNDDKQNAYDTNTFWRVLFRATHIHTVRHSGLIPQAAYSIDKTYEHISHLEIITRFARGQELLERPWLPWHGIWNLTGEGGRASACGAAPK